MSAEKEREAQLTCPHIPNQMHLQVTFRIGTSATSPLTFGASVWKAGTKLYDATPVLVRLINID